VAPKHVRDVQLPQSQSQSHRMVLRSQGAPYGERSPSTSTTPNTSSSSSPASSSSSSSSSSGSDHDDEAAVARGTHVRGNRARLPPQEVALSDDQIRRVVKVHLELGTRLSIQYARLGNDRRCRDSGSITARGTGGEVEVQFQRLALTHLPPRDPSLLILEIQVQQHPLILKPIAECARRKELDDPSITHHIYVDGGAQGDKGAAAGIHVIAADGSSSHSIFVAQSTNNIMELASAIAALNLVERTSTIVKAVIVMDSQLTYDFLHKQRKSQMAHLKPLVDELRSVYARVAGRAILALMRRSYGNYADTVCNAAMMSRHGVGSHAIFPRIPDAPPPAPKRPPRTLKVHDVDSSPLVSITSIDDFLATRHIQAKTRCPDSAEPLFAGLAATYLKRALDATSSAQFASHSLDFMLVPTVYLPHRMGTSNIIRRLASGNPRQLHTPPPPPNPDDAVDVELAPPPPSVKPDSQRLDEAIERKAKDFKLRSANSLLRSTAECGHEVSFENKMDALRAKILETPVGGEAFVSQIPKRAIPFFTAREVIDGLHSLNRQAATSIDGWTKDLLISVIAHQSSFADDLATWLTRLLTDDLDPLLEQCFLASRAVAIPSDNKIRPVSVANIYIKLMGATAIKRDNRFCAPNQYGVSRKHGCHRIIHFMRQAYRAGKAIVKIDMSNAFNTVTRFAVEQSLTSADETLRQYFRLIYGTTASLAVYGPLRTIGKLLMGEGVRQGDSASSYLFCHGVDAALRAVAAVFPDTMMYMDDITIAVDRHRIDEAVRLVRDSFAHLGLHVNVTKSQVLIPPSSENRHRAELPRRRASLWFSAQTSPTSPLCLSMNNWKNRRRTSTYSISPKCIRKSRWHYFASVERRASSTCVKLAHQKLWSPL
jgi:ribonuclease HI